MATFSERETRLRRYLRDPNADVWSQKLLIQLWNEAQHQFNRDSKVLVKIGGIHVPARTDYTRSYLWEEDYVSGAIRRLGLYYDATEYLCMFAWEVEQIRGYTPQSTDGYRSCYSWEIHTCGQVVQDVDVYKLPWDFDQPVLLAYDREPLVPVAEEDLMNENSQYRTCSGEPRNYYRIGQDEDREFAMYPRPSSPVVDTLVDITSDVDCGYTYDWELSNEHMPSTSKSYGKWTETEGNYETVFPWEEQFMAGDRNPPPEYDFHGYYVTNNWDVELMAHYEGMIVGIASHTMQGEEGTVYRMDTALIDEEYGIPVDYVDMDNNITLVYKPRITEVISSDDEIKNWLDWQLKYIERLTVSLAFRINNDRYSNELASFWMGRYLEGLNVMRRYKGKRSRGRRPALKTQHIAPNIKRLADLPDTYPSAWR